MAGQAFIVSLLGLDGTPESGGKLYSYSRGTSTPRPLYTNVGLTVPATNPVIADVLGTIDCYFDTALQYTWRAKTADDATTLWEVEVVGGVLALTYVNPDYAVNPLIETSWVPALGAPLGSGWVDAFALPLPDGLSGNFIKPLATYGALTALTEATGLQDNGVYCTYARTTEEDGGFGFWRYDAASTATVDGGTILAIDGGGAGRFFRLHDGTFYPEWFGSSADWGAALTAAWTACGVRGGTVKMRQGVDYIFTTQATMPVSEFNITWDIRGCRIRPRYASGATFKFGSGASLLQEITILANSGVIDPGTSSEGSQSQPLLELRGVRTMRILGVRMLNIYQLAKWGDASDAQPCYQIFLDSCDVNMRLNADGGHTHGIAGDGASGGLYLTNSYIEGDATNVASAVNFLHLTSAQGPARLDHVSVLGGNLKAWDRCISAVDARIVNIETDQSARFDEAVDAAFYVEATSGATKGGAEIMRISGTLGSGPSGTTGKMLRIKADKSNSDITFEDIILEGVIHSKAGGPSVHVTTSGTGAVASLHVKSIHIADTDPVDAAQDAIILDGDIDEALVDDWTIQHKSTSTFDYRYGVYNNTAATKSVRITRNFTMDRFTTAVVYDPNIGDFSIGRWCEIDANGRNRTITTLPFMTALDMAAGVTGGDFAMVAGEIGSVKLPAPGRGRIIRLTASINGTVLTNDVQIYPFVAGARDNNLDVSITSADGADPAKSADYLAGSAAIAANALIRVMYDTHASLTPTTLDAMVYLVFAEM